jgi:colanic acid/amylovoran biosynthesis protein
MGDAMILNATIQLLRETLGEVDITVLSYNPAIDDGRCTVRVLESLGRSWRALPRTAWLLLRCLFWAMLWNGLHLNFHWLVSDSVLQQYANADAVIVRGGDTLTKHYGTLSLASHLTSILPAILMRKPVLLLGHSIGPFGTLRNAAKAVLNRVDIIVLRERLSKEHLRLLGISNPRVYLTVDLSIHLGNSNSETVRRVCQSEGISSDVKWVGVSLSQMAPRFLKHSGGLAERRQEYARLMTKMIDYLIKEFDTNVLLLPSALGPNDWDDRIISRLVYSNANHPERIRLVNNEHSPEELAGIIGCCEIFIGSRMHACLAALMNCVPTIALGYGDKFHGIVGEMWGQEGYVLSLSDLQWESLKKRIDGIWNSREIVRRNLHARRRYVLKRARLNYTILNDFLESFTATIHPR